MQRRYAALCAHYGCQAVFCNARAGNEKGHALGQVGYIRRNALIPQDQGFADPEDVQQAIDRVCAERNARTLTGRERSIAEELARERRQLLPLPQQDMEVGECRLVRVSSFSRVRFEGNEYSVPAGLEGQELTLRTLPGVVRLCLRGSCVAVHYRLTLRGRIADALAHHLLRLLERPRSIAYAAVVRAVVPVHERSRLAAAGTDLCAIARCLHHHARLQLEHDMPPQEGQPLPPLEQLLRRCRRAARAQAMISAEPNLSAYDALATMEAC